MRGPQIFKSFAGLTAPRSMTKDGMPWWMWAIVIFIALALVGGLAASFR